MQRGSGRAMVVLAVGNTVATSLPVFLIGALFVQLQRDIHAPVWVLGAAVAAYWAAAAVVSMLSGRIITAIGSRRATIVSLATVVVSLAGSFLVVPSWPWLIAWTVIGGAANGLGHPASNHLISLRVGTGRIATALGIKQGAVPFAAFIAGLTVPVIALTLGWQWGFAAAAVLAVLLVLAFARWGPARLPGRRPRRPHVPLTGPMVRYLMLVASVTTLGAAAAGAASAFAVTAGIERGLSDAVAGILLSAGSLLGAACRVVAGRLADRSHGRIALPLTAGMLAVGGLGLVLMAIGTTATFVIGIILALGIGWGWTGLTHFVVSRTAGPATPSATGIVQTGSYLGSGAGPLLFGIVFTLVDSPLIWLVVAAAQLTSAVLALRLIRRPPPPVPVIPGG